jgi:hypothetical protein
VKGGVRAGLLRLLLASCAAEGLFSRPALEIRVFIRLGPDVVSREAQPSPPAPLGKASFGSRLDTAGVVVKLRPRPAVDLVIHGLGEGLQGRVNI